MTLQVKFNELNGVIQAAERSSTKLEGGVRCESARCRSNLSQAGKLITELRKMCLEQSKAMPKKVKKFKIIEPDAEPDEAPDGEPDNEALPEPLQLERKQTVVFEEPLIEPSKKPKSRAKPKPKAS